MKYHRPVGCAYDGRGWAVPVIEFLPQPMKVIAITAIEVSMDFRRRDRCQLKTPGIVDEPNGGLIRFLELSIGSLFSSGEKRIENLVRLGIIFGWIALEHNFAKKWISGRSFKLCPAELNLQS